MPMLQKLRHHQVIDGCLAVSVDQLLSSLQFPSFRPPPSSVTVSRPSSTLAPLQQPRVPSVSNHLPVQGCFYFSHSYLWIVYDVRNIFLPLAIIYPHKAAFTFNTVTYESVYHLRNIFLPLAIIYPYKAAFTFNTVTYESVYHLRNIFLPLAIIYPYKAAFTFHTVTYGLSTM